MTPEEIQALYLQFVDERVGIQRPLFPIELETLSEICEKMTQPKFEQWLKKVCQCTIPMMMYSYMDQHIPIGFWTHSQVVQLNRPFVISFLPGRVSTIEFLSREFNVRTKMSKWHAYYVKVSPCGFLLRNDMNDGFPYPPYPYDTIDQMISDKMGIRYDSNNDVDFAERVYAQQSFLPFVPRPSKYPDDTKEDRQQFGAKLMEMYHEKCAATLSELPSQCWNPQLMRFQYHSMGNDAFFEMFSSRLELLARIRPCPKKFCYQIASRGRTLKLLTTCHVKQHCLIRTCDYDPNLLTVFSFTPDRRVRERWVHILPIQDEDTNTTYNMYYLHGQPDHMVEDLVELL